MMMTQKTTAVTYIYSDTSQCDFRFDLFFSFSFSFPVIFRFSFVLVFIIFSF